MDNIVHVGGRVKGSATERDGASAATSQRSGQMLCLNAGSSSLKFKLFDLASFEPEAPLVSGSVKLDSSSDTALVEMACPKNERRHQETRAWTEIASAEVVEYLLETMADLLPGHGDDRLEITTVVHRIVHGAHLDQCVEITPSDQHHLKTLQFLAEFAPLHNAVSVQLIRICLGSKRLQTKHGLVNVCCFDTTFHRSIDEARSGYMVDSKLAGERLPGGMELRKWGFHGLSYASVLKTVSRAMGKERGQLNLIVLHLGSGSSMCSVVRGKSWETTMGLTPLEGLPGATRSGSVDPVLALHLPDGSEQVEVADGIKVSKAEMVLNKQSGFKAVAGTSDFAEIVKRRTEFLQGRTISKDKEEERERDRRAVLAFDMFVDRIVGVLGGYAIKMCAEGGVHAVVLAGGIGEASGELHRELARRVEASWVSVAEEKVVQAGQDGKKGKCWQLPREQLGLRGTTRTVAMGQAVPWLVCKTDEEGEMAREVMEAWARSG